MVLGVGDVALLADLLLDGEASLFSPGVVAEVGRPAKRGLGAAEPVVVGVVAAGGRMGERGDHFHLHYHHQRVKALLMLLVQYEGVKAPGGDNAFVVVVMGVDDCRWWSFVARVSTPVVSSLSMLHHHHHCGPSR
jgi:hypothetical protein